MKKAIVITLALLFSVTSQSWGADKAIAETPVVEVTPENTLDDVKTKVYWVFIQTADKSAYNTKDISGLSQAGDVVLISEIVSGQEPTPTEQKEFRIVKMELTELGKYKLLEKLTEENIDKPEAPTIKANRKIKIDFDKTEIEETNGLTDAIKILDTKATTTADLAKYEWLRKKYVFFDRPLKLAARAIIPNAYAATNISKICAVGSNCTDEDYNTVSAWESAKEGDLVTATTIEIAEIYDDDGDIDDSCRIWGSTTSSSYYMMIRAGTGEKHSGKIYSSGSTYSGAAVTQSGAFDYPFTVGDDNVRVKDLIIDQDRYSYYGCFNVDDGVDNLIVDGCILYQSEGWGGEPQKAIIRSVQYANLTHYYTNNMILTRVDGVDHNPAEGGSKYFINNTFIKRGTTGNTAIYDNDSHGSTYAYNNIFYNFTTSMGGSYITEDYNCISDTSGTGAHDLESRTSSDFDFTSLTSGAEDTHIASTSDCVDVGSDYSASMTYDADIDGDTRSGTWDIGADEIVAAAPTFIPWITISRLFQ